jgi:glycosidase
VRRREGLPQRGRHETGSTANDLGGLPADRLVSGYDPTAKGFYHGGDVAGIRRRLRYIKRLGTTAIWLTPSFKNKAVRLEDGLSAGYHGYWITDLTKIDPTSAPTTSSRRSSTRRTAWG